MRQRSVACGAWTFVFVLVLLPSAPTVLADGRSLLVVPNQVVLSGNFARGQLLARRSAADEDAAHSDDVTAQAAYISSDPSVVAVIPSGQLQAVTDGEARIIVSLGQERAVIPVAVTGIV